MNPWFFPLALIAFLGFVMVMPPWQYYLAGPAADLPTEARFLVSLVLPATILLFLASWLPPGGA